MDISAAAGVGGIVETRRQSGVWTAWVTVTLSRIAGTCDDATVRGAASAAAPAARINNSRGSVDRQRYLSISERLGDVTFRTSSLIGRRDDR